MPRRRQTPACVEENGVDFIINFKSKEKVSEPNLRVTCPIRYYHANAEVEVPHSQNFKSQGKLLRRTKYPSSCDDLQKVSQAHLELFTICSQLKV